MSTIETSAGLTAAKHPPPFDEDAARRHVQAAGDAWNLRVPDRPPSGDAASCGLF